MKRRKRPKPTRLASAIADTEAQIWRDVEALLSAAATKDRAMRRLLADRLMPLMASDTPADEWVAISRRAQALAALKDVERAACSPRRTAK